MKIDFRGDNPRWAVKTINDKGEAAYYSSDGGADVFIATSKRRSFLRYGIRNQKLSLLQPIQFKFADTAAAMELNKKSNDLNEEEQATMFDELDEIMKETDKELSNASTAPGVKEKKAMNELDEIMRETDKELSDTSTVQPPTKFANFRYPPAMFST